ncbi:unnamed protein product [Bursaphelenchus xylophilus]|uniref:Phospholipase n=1 Tax=Bursaphelenchus xylophilus TaxID=6326 RepID=A0A7I8WY41_BURXY|nr:unnamed protein product [Bursaphelenchus xylophilus]CAG9100574.1 unnamed protein product [Bursaphelenchus xylophilus]
MVNSPTKSEACDCGGSELPKPKFVKKKGYIPYGLIYKTQDEFQKVGYWIPGVAVTAKITKVEKDSSTNLHLLNPWIYTVEATHGRYKWTVFKRYADFAQLAKSLGGHRRLEQIKSPFRRARNKIEMSFQDIDQETKDYELQILEKGKELGDFGTPRTDTDSGDEPTSNGKTPDSPEEEVDEDDDGPPRFPLLPDSMISEVHMERRRVQLEKWLRHALTEPVNRDYHQMAEFLEVSRYSFINELGGKHKEGSMKKRPGGGKVYIGCKQFCVKWILPWMERYLILKDSYVCYINSNETVRLVLLFDEQFEIDSPDVVTSTKPKYMFLSNASHVLAMKLQLEDEAFYWKAAIRQVLESTGQVWLKPKPFGSSYPTRENQYIQYFVDAKDYWERAAAMIELAREEIFIADWWLCPEIYMRRPMAEGNHWRLDNVLKRQAEKGVRIFILIYKEFELTLNLNTVYAKKLLQKLHPNIKVMRHPDHYFGTGTFFWSHHEKLLIIDQLIAFVGGLDLCYGRWDNSTHVLADLGSVQYAPTAEGHTLTKGLASAVEEMASEVIKSDKHVHEGEEQDNDDEEAEVSHIKHEILDETGHRIGKTKTSIVQTSREEDEDKKEENKNEPEAKEEENNQRKEHKRTFRDVMSQIKARKASPNKRSRSPTPFDNVPKSTEKPANVKRTPSGPAGITADLMNPHHVRSPQVIRESPFGKPKTLRWHSVVIGSDPSHSPGPLDEPKSFDVTQSTSSITPTKDKGDKLPLKKIIHEPKNRTVMRRVVSNLKTNRNAKRWKMLLDKDKPEDVTDEYVINYCKVQETEVDVSGLQGAGKLWPGKDYVNYLVKDFVDVHEAYSDFIDRYRVPRTPWHDIHSVVYGEVARDVARHFIQRWNATKTEKHKNNKDYPYLLPKSYDSVKVPRVFINKDTHNCDIQVLRSVAHWSALIDGKEDSIQDAYVKLIQNAEHFVYIENQFFVSMINSSEVTNEICKALCDRICRAHREGTTFRVYVLIPLLPGFEGDLGSGNYSALMAVLHWTLSSISKGPHSLIENLKINGIEKPFDYVSFCSLRTYDELCGKLVTEMVYIHCKLLIVDDKYVIIGSANINDRSQLGMRDSEVCVLATDREFVPSRMNGKEYMAGKFASTLRKRLMKEHLGLLPEAFHKAPIKPSVVDLDDPVHDSFYHDVWWKAVKGNTEIFEEVFRAFPTNLVSSKDELVVWRDELPMAEYNPDLARHHLKKLWGNIVQFPESFLSNEDLAPTIMTKEGLVPSAIFT